MTRIELVLNELKLYNSLTITELSNKFNVSEMTIRRDLEILEQKGEIIRTKGGATYKSVFDLSFVDRKNKNIEQKHIISKLAIKLIDKGDSILLDSSSTSYILSNYLIDDITVITNNLNIANNLLNKKDIRVILLGGIIKNDSASIVGTDALSILDKYYVDKAFISSKTISIDGIVADSSQEEGIMKQKFLEISEKKYLIADSSKFDNRSFFKISNLSKFDTVITNYESDEKNNLIKSICDKSRVSYMSDN